MLLAVSLKTANLRCPHSIPTAVGYIMADIPKTEINNWNARSLVMW